MVTEAKDRTIAIDENTFTLEGNLAIVAKVLAEQKFRQRQMGKLIAQVIATTPRRADDDSCVKRDKALRELSLYFPANHLTRFIARLENPIFDRKPMIESLLNKRTEVNNRWLTQSLKKELELNRHLETVKLSEPDRI